MTKLEVGMYVRTTYGIGKITNAYVIYSDDGYLWHLCYMTDNSKIEIGIYPENLMLGGEIQKNHNIKYEPLNVNTQKIFDMVYENKIEEPVCYVPVRKGVPRNAELFDYHKFIKSSFNIIDLIEVGDYVNGCYVSNKRSSVNEHLGGHPKGIGIIKCNAYFNQGNYNDCEFKWIEEKDIKSIVTKEQFESMKYEVE